MEELGRKFKNRRQELEIELATASEETNIRTDYLQAIEAGNFDRIEAEVYLKGFLKVYSNYLDLDTEAIMEEYQQLKSEEADSEVEPEDQKGQVKEKIKGLVDKHQNLLLGLFISGLILLLIVGVVYLGTIAYQQFTEHNAGQKIQSYISSLTGNSGSGQSEANPQETTDATSSPPENNQGQAEENTQSQVENESNKSSSETTTSEQKEGVREKNSDSEQTEANVETKKAETTEKDVDGKKTETDVKSKEPQPEGESGQQTSEQLVEKETKQQTKEEQAIAIQIKTVEESWYSVQVNGQEVFRGLVSPGITKQFSGQEVKVRIGNAAGVKIIKGDQTLGPFGEKGEIVTKVFSSEKTD